MERVSDPAPNRHGTFVSVGNATQSFARLLEAVDRIAFELPQPVIVQHGNTAFRPTRCRAVAFVGMSEFEGLVAGAELLILHAGAGSVIHSVRAGKIPVVVPRSAAHGEHVDNHQFEFALALAEAGKVVMVEDPVLVLEASRIALSLQDRVGSTDSHCRMIDLVGACLDAYARENE